MQMKEKVSSMRICLIITFIWLTFVCVYGQNAPSDNFKIAFIADAHFHDVYASFQDSSFRGLTNNVTGKNATIRTMEAQLMSTRLFNENYFALYATLDDLVRKGIKYVGLVGDFSDDGQIVHLRKLQEILDFYVQKYGMRFFAVPGNHDPNRPEDYPGGKADFLGNGGMEQPVFSKELEKQGRITNSRNRLPAIFTSEITPLGYEGIINIMKPYGFFPQKSYCYWATPYSTYDYNTYSYAKAIDESALQSRSYEICSEGTGGEYKKPDYSNCTPVVDATYLVEPIKGIWLLAIDANVYVPDKDADMRSVKFKGSGDAGYNQMISHKKHVIEWISEVVKKAEAEGKILITFSHFPMIDFYDRNTDILENVFGKGKLDIKRMPAEETMKTMARTGVRLNFGGHLHYNDTGVREYDNEFLVNIQVPSLAAYIPGYKILTVRNKDVFEVETVEIGEVPGFKELFEHYRIEHQYRSEKDSLDNWNIKILESDNYIEYTDWHLSELVRKRFLSQWQDELRGMLKILNGKDILVYTQLDANVSMPDLELIKSNDVSRLDPDILNAWNNAEKNAEKLAENYQLRLDDFNQWSGFDLATDFYRIMNADELALKHIGKDRIKEYSVIYNNIRNKRVNNNERFWFYFSNLFVCLYNFSNAEPCNKFIIDFSEKKIVDLENNTNRIR